jgi:hypothetical protein
MKLTKLCLPGSWGELQGTDKIITTDWMAIGQEGWTVTKGEVMAAHWPGASAIQFVELGALKVRVSGNTAVVAATCGANEQRRRAVPSHR